MSGRRDKEVSAPDGPDANAWMVTFSDLLMLMLTFFVLLLSMSSLDQQQLEEIVRPGLQQNPAGTHRPDGVRQEIEPIVPQQLQDSFEAKWNERHEGEDGEELEEVMDEVLVRALLGEDAWTERRPYGLLINVDGRIAFDEGSSRLSPAARDFVAELVELAGVVGAQIQVEVYSSDETNLESQIRSWDLALRRADTVAVFMTRQGFRPEHLRIMGYGYAAGRDEMAFMRQRQLLRLTLLTDPSRFRG